MKKNYADMDPIEELRAIREELSREFPTAKALREYLWKNFPGSVPPSQPQRKGRRASTKTKANARPAMRQRKAAREAQARNIT